MSKDKIIGYCNKVIEISLYIVVFFIPISKSFIEIFISLMLLAWIIKKITNKTRIINLFPSTYLNLPIFLYLLAITASAIFSSNHAISFRHLIFKTTEYLLFFFIIVEVMDKRILKNVIITIVISATLISIDGIFQYFTKWDFLRHRISPIAQRISASFNIPNDFATYLVSILPIVTSISFLKFKRQWLRIAIILISFLLFICLVLSATRSAWLAMLLTLPFILILRNKKLAVYILLLIILSSFMLSMVSSISEYRIKNFFTINLNSLIPDQHRRFLWQISLNMFKNRPLLGQGLGTFMFNFEKFQPKDYPFNWGICYAHNCFLQIAAETGQVGLLTFVLIIISLFFISYKKIRQLKENQFYYNILCGFLLGIFTYLVNSFFDTNLYSLPLAVLFWFIVGLTISIIKISEADSSSD